MEEKIKTKIELSWGEKLSVSAVLAGSVLGSFAWIFILGIFINRPIVLIIAFIASLLGMVVPYKIYIKNKNKVFSIIGFVSVWIIMVNGIFINVLYKWIPERIGQFTTGKVGMSLTKINISLWILLLFSLLSFAVDLLDMFSVNPINLKSKKE